LRSLLIYTPIVTSKLTYICDFIFRERLGLGYRFVTEDGNYSGSTDDLKLHYVQMSAEGGTEGMSILDSEYFSDFSRDAIPVFDKDIVFNEGRSSFDLFASCFYLLARVEEYGTEERDEHGRFLSSQSILAQKELLEFPIIDYWIQILQQAIESHYNIELQSPHYTFTSTIDVDHLYAFKHKSIFILLAGILKDVLSLRFQKLKDRSSSDDPYDIFDQLLEWHTSISLTPLFFMLTAERNTYDRSLSPSHSEFAKRVKQLSKYGLGLHPSYDSNKALFQLIKEKQKLESIAGQPITQSRQHFLKLKFPTTYQRLIQAGVTSDHSMGYPDRLGFRAATSSPFSWYDLEADCATELRVHPFCLMDVTLKNYLGLGPSTALAHAHKIITRIKEVNGQCTIIWHNSSFYAGEGWAGWQEVYLNILKMSKA